MVYVREDDTTTRAEKKFQRILFSGFFPQRKKEISTILNCHRYFLPLLFARKEYLYVNNCWEPFDGINNWHLDPLWIKSDILLHLFETAQIVPNNLWFFMCVFAIHSREWKMSLSNIKHQSASFISRSWTEFAKSQPHFIQTWNSILLKTNCHLLITVIETVKCTSLYFKLKLAIWDNWKHLKIKPVLVSINLCFSWKKNRSTQCGYKQKTTHPNKV